MRDIQRYCVCGCSVCRCFSPKCVRMCWTTAAPNVLWDATQLPSLFLESFIINWIDHFDEIEVSSPFVLLGCCTQCSVIFKASWDFPCAYSSIYLHTAFQKDGDFTCNIQKCYSVCVTFIVSIIVVSQCLSGSAACFTQQFLKLLYFHIVNCINKDIEMNKKQPAAWTLRFRNLIVRMDSPRWHAEQENCCVCVKIPAITGNVCGRWVLVGVGVVWCQVQSALPHSDPGWAESYTGQGCTLWSIPV